jgi:hypothetical protein
MQSSCHEVAAGMAIEINLPEASVMAVCMFFPENFFSGDGARKRRLNLLNFGFEELLR